MVILNTETQESQRTLRVTDRKWKTSPEEVTEKEGKKAWKSRCVAFT